LKFVEYCCNSRCCDSSSSDTGYNVPIGTTVGVTLGAFIIIYITISCVRKKKRCQVSQSSAIQSSNVTSTNSSSASTTNNQDNQNNNRNDDDFDKNLKEYPYVYRNYNEASPSYELNRTSPNGVSSNNNHQIEPLPTYEQVTNVKI
jgi:hypothetical protein